MSVVVKLVVGAHDGGPVQIGELGWGGGGKLGRVGVVGRGHRGWREWEVVWLRR
jgi:hypothetical protein